MSLTPDRQPQQPTQAKITYGGVDVLIDYAKLNTLGKEKYGAYFDGVLRMLTNDNDVAISGQFSELEGDALRWFVYALHLYAGNSNALPRGFDHRAAVSRLLGRASLHEYLPGAEFNYFEREALRASGWVSAVVLKSLTAPSTQTVDTLAGIYNPVGAETGAGELPVIGPLQPDILRTALIPALEKVVYEQADFWIPPTGTMLEPESIDRLRTFAKFIQSYVAVMMRPYADGCPDGPYFSDFHYELRLQSTWVLPAGPANQLSYLLNRAKAIGWSTEYGELLAKANYDERRPGDKKVLVTLLEEKLTQDVELTKRVRVAIKHTGAHTAGEGNISIQPVFPRNWGPKGKRRWYTIRTLVHELLHRLVHQDFNAKANEIRHGQIIREGFIELLTVDIFKQLYQDITAKGKAAVLLNGVEADAQPDNTFFDVGYGSAGAAAVKIRALVGDDNVRAAFFLGATNLVGL